MASLTNRPIYDVRKEAPVRSDDHKQFVRSLPCVVPGCRRKSEAAHIGPHGMSQKASDLKLAPICYLHHRKDRDSLHRVGRVRFDARYKVDLMAIAERLSRKPRLRIEAGYYVADVEGSPYILRPVSDGALASWRAALGIFREVLASGS